MTTYNIRMLAGCAAMLAIGAGALPATTITNLGTGQVPGIVDTASDLANHQRANRQYDRGGGAH